MRSGIHCGDRLPGKSLEHPLNQALSPGWDPEQQTKYHILLLHWPGNLISFGPPHCLLPWQNVSSTDEVFILYVVFARIFNHSDSKPGTIVCLKFRCFIYRHFKHIWHLLLTVERLTSNLCSPSNWLQCGIWLVSDFQCLLFFSPGVSIRYKVVSLFIHS